MKKIILTLLTTILLMGCSSNKVDETNIEAKLVLGKDISTLALNDQFEKAHTLNDTTTKLIFAFAKEPAHICNDFFETQTPTYLKDNKTQFIADVSSAPSLIRSMFILPGLKDFKHTVLLLDDKAIAAPYRKGMNTESIVLVKIVSGVITEITTLNSTQELQKAIENK